MIKDVQCRRCGQSFVPEKVIQQILKVANEKHLELFHELFWLCQNCRRETFAQNLIGSELQKVARVPHVAKRRREK